MAEHEYQHAEGVVLTRVQLWLGLLVTCVTLLGGSAAAMRWVAEDVAVSVAQQEIRRVMHEHEARPHSGTASHEFVRSIDADVEALKRDTATVRAVQSGFSSDIANIKSSLNRIEDKLDDIGR